MPPKDLREPTSSLTCPAALPGSRVWLRLLLAAMVAALLILPAGCLSTLLWPVLEPVATIVDFELSDQSGLATSQTETASLPSVSSGLQTEATVPQAATDDEISRMLLDGLQARQREISLDEAFPAHAVSEKDIQQTIDHVFKLYQAIYSRHPEFYYLDGSINVSYTTVKGSDSYLDSLTVKPQYWPATENLSNASLDQLIGEIDRIVDKLVLEIRKETDTPWKQLLLVHDFLIRHIAYDETLDPAKNQVISALLDGETLCQGYAQTFQLIGQRLGFDVRLISGESGGAGHAWNLVKLDGKFYHVDVTHDDPTPDRGPKAAIGHIHFLRSDSVMKETHQWNAAEYPACPTDGAQYYRQNKLTVDTRKTLEKLLGQYVGSLDFSSSESTLLELLYVGSDLPDEREVGQMLDDALSALSASYSIHYSLQVAKNVISLGISP